MVLYCLILTTKPSRLRKSVKYNSPQPALRSLGERGDCSMIVKDEAFGLHTPWHYHPELEFIYFREGVTDGVMGNGFCEFQAGEMVLLGSNLPHVLRENEPYVIASSSPPAGLIVHFRPDFLGEDFFSRPEWVAVRQLIDRSARGIRFRTVVPEPIIDTLDRLASLSPTQRLLEWLGILDHLAREPTFEYLTPAGFVFTPEVEDDRLDRVKAYVFTHFHRQIGLEEMAKVANLSKSTFCRFFKSRTLKTFTVWLNEVRISYVTKVLLAEPSRPIADIAYSAGYSNLSYFNRQFRRIVGMTPRRFRRSQRR